MTSLALHEEDAISVSNPLDLVEQVISANEWVYDRRCDSDMAAEGPANGAITACISAGRTRFRSCISPAPST